MVEMFIKCKDACTCKKRKCMAIGLKQCPTCKNIIRSVCRKLSCRVDGTKPLMILPAATRKTIPKRLFDCDSDESDVTQIDESDNDISEGESDSEDYDDGIDNAIERLKMTWKSLSPPVTESSILGKWYAVIYTTKKSNKLFIGNPRGELSQFFLKFETLRFLYE